MGREGELVLRPPTSSPHCPAPSHSPSPWGAHIHPQMMVGWMMDGWVVGSLLKPRPRLPMVQERTQGETVHSHRGRVPASPEGVGDFRSNQRCPVLPDRRTLCQNGQRRTAQNRLWCPSPTSP